MRPFFKKCLAVCITISLVIFCCPLAFAEETSDTIFTTDNGYRYKIIGEGQVAFIISNGTYPDNNSGYTGEVVIPENVEYENNTYTVTEIAEGAFAYSTVTKVTLPSTIKEMEGSAFLNCTTVTEINLNAGLMEIGPSAFFNCSALATLSVPATVTTLGVDAFSRCSALDSITIPAGVTDSLAIQSLYNGSTGEFPGTVTYAEGSPFEIDEGVLYNGNTLVCLVDDSVTEVKVRAGTTEILAKAFQQTMNQGYPITSVTFVDDSLQTIGDYAFDHCTSLASIDFPSGLKTIGQSAFSNCSSLKTVKLPEGLTRIGKSAFMGASSLEYMNIPSTVESLGVTFVGGVKEDTVIVFEGDTPPAFESETVGPSIAPQTSTALDGISGSNTKPEIYYPANAASEYQSNSALTNAGLVDNPDEGEEPSESGQQGYSIGDISSPNLYVGDTATVTATVPDGATLAVSSSATSVAEVSSDGKTITAKGNGTATITVQIKKGDDIILAEKTFQVTVTTYTPPVTPSDPTYPPEITDSENGSVSTSPSRPEQGDKVTITTEPDEGYKVDTVTVVDEDGDRVTVTNAGDGKYTFTQPKGEVTITVTFVWDNPFTDINDPEQWYYEAVEYVEVNGLMAGLPGGLFAPNKELTRAEAVQILYNLEGQPTVTGDATFTDLTDDWYVKAIAWAETNGVVDGYGDGTFHPNDTVSREEFAQMMYNYTAFKKLDTSATADLTKFPDGETVAEWAETAMEWANGNELINGHANGTLDPAGTTIRAQAASILMNFDLNLVKAG